MRWELECDDLLSLAGDDSLAGCACWPRAGVDGLDLRRLRSPSKRAGPPARNMVELISIARLGSRHDRFDLPGVVGGLRRDLRSESAAWHDELSACPLVLGVCAASTG